MARPAHNRLYGRRWRKLRAAVLAAEPLCRYCKAQGRTTAATVVDHIRPHKGDVALFYDTANLQPLCKRCHDSHKQSRDRTGKLRGATADGRPLDPGHHWNL